MTAENKRTVKLLKWIQEHPGWWYLICTPNEEYMDNQKMRMLIEQLDKEGFYELIFVLLTVHRQAVYMKGFPEYMLLDRITAAWDTDRETIIRSMLDHLE